MSVFSRNRTTTGTLPDAQRSRVFAASRTTNTTTSSPSLRPPRQPSWTLTMFLLVGFLILAGAVTYGAIGEAAGLPLFQPHARISLTPDVRTVQQSMTVLATTDNQPKAAHIRLFSGKSPSKQANVQATGIQQARSAQGTLSFYNQSSSWQPVPAGTTYTGRDGVVISIETAANVPPWTLNGMGSTTVLARAVQTGTAGNIASGDITVCCGSNGLLIKNATAFSGGQDAATIVTTQDIEKAKASLLPSQKQVAMQALQTQIGSDDWQLKDAVCQPSVQSNQQAGSLASSVMITLSVTCQAPVVNRKTVKSLIDGAFIASEAVHQLGAAYRPQGPLTTNVEQAQVTSAPQNTFSITVPVHGTFVYQLNTRAIQQQLSTQLTGTSTEQAQSLLTQMPGVSHVDIQVTGGWRANTLPDDKTRITIIEVQPSV